MRRAADAGRGWSSCPEKWPFMHGPRLLEGAEPLDGPSLAAARLGARAGSRDRRGSVVERVEGDARARNTSVLLPWTGPS